MSEIKTSAKGIDYAKPCVLKTKSRVYSQAVLSRVRQLKRLQRQPKL